MQEYHSKINYHYVLFGILVLALFLRFWNLGAQDVVGDDATYAYRSIGYFDHMVSQLQTTPLQWFETIPSWVKFSFHDHPPLVFLLHFFFFKIFGGMSTFLSRVPDALMGVGSLWVLYLISLNIFSGFQIKSGMTRVHSRAQRHALVAAFLLAVDPYHLWVSRLSLLESGVIFFSLLSVYYFLCIVGNNQAEAGTSRSLRDTILFGLFTGFALISKYTAFYLLPTYFVYLLWKRRDIFRVKEFWYGVCVFFLTISPVIVYNLQMQKARGHMDLQLSALFGQNTDDWTIFERSVDTHFLQNASQQLVILWQNMNPLILALALFSVLFLFLRKKHIQENQDETHSSNRSIVLLLLTFLFLQFVLIPPAQRLLPLFVPWVILLVLLAFSHSEQGKAGLFTALRASLQNDKLRYALIIFIGFWLTFFGYNSQVALQPVNGFLLSTQTVERNYHGFEQLDGFVEERIGKEEFTFTPGVKGSSLFIWDENINYFPKIWYIQRWLSYQGIPFASTGELVRSGLESFQEKGYHTFYFIKATEDTLLVPQDARSKSPDVLLQSIEDTTRRVDIRNTQGELMFNVYSL